MNIISHGYVLFGPWFKLEEKTWRPQPLSEIVGNYQQYIPTLQEIPNIPFILSQDKPNKNESTNKQRVIFHPGIVQGWVKRNSKQLLGTGVIPIIASEKAIRNALVCNQWMGHFNKNPGCDIKIKIMGNNSHDKITYYQWTCAQETARKQSYSSPSGFAFEAMCLSKDTPSWMEYCENPTMQKEYELFHITSFYWTEGERTYRIFMYSEIDGLTQDLETVEIKSCMAPRQTSEVIRDTREKDLRNDFKLLNLFCKMQLSLIDHLVIGYWDWDKYSENPEELLYQWISTYQLDSVNIKLANYKPFYKFTHVKKEYKFLEFQHNNFNKIFQIFSSQIQNSITNKTSAQSYLRIKCYRNEEFLTPLFEWV